MALVPLLLLTSVPSAYTDGTIPPVWPGLPPVQVPSGYASQAKVSSQGTGISEVARARQWIKIPAQAAVALSMFQPKVVYPADDPQGRQYSDDLLAAVFLSSPAEATKGYGIGMPITVRTVAFGAIPVQASIRLEQLRDTDDLPKPLYLRFPRVGYRGFKEIRPGVFSSTRMDSELTGKVIVRVTSLAVDGVDLGLADCVSAPIILNLHGNPTWKDDPESDPFTTSFAQGSTAMTNWAAARGIGTNNGGAVTGEIDIPAFSHCLTGSGEDVSPLLTGAVSGSGNHVTVGYASIAGDGPVVLPCGSAIPVPPWRTVRRPFQGDPSDCDPNWGPPTFDYPARPN